MPTGTPMAYVAATSHRPIPLTTNTTRRTTHKPWCTDCKRTVDLQPTGLCNQCTSAANIRAAAAERRTRAMGPRGDRAGDRLLIDIAHVLQREATGSELGAQATEADARRVQDAIANAGYKMFPDSKPGSATPPDAAGEEITVANVEMAPLQPIGTLRTALLSNPTASEIEASCPDEDVTPETCSQYVAFASGAAIAWPHQLAPYSSEIVYSRAGMLVDSDGDDIADIQDQCPLTPRNSITNSLGCPFPLGF